MASAVRQGRWTAEIEGDFVVFLIGARFEKLRPWRSAIDLGGRRGMKHMLDYLVAHPDKGLLGYQLGLPTIVQYWRSFEHLERYARAQDLEHFPAWVEFNKKNAHSRGDVGIWHETYLVPAGRYEAIYGNMPRIGLAAVAGHVPIARRGQSAARRVGVRVADEVPVPVYPNP
jgi:hypothetical protein